MRRQCVIAFLCLICSSHAFAENMTSRIAGAKAGETVRLPAGTFEIGNAVVPPGVTIEGAGYAQTILKVTVSADGLIVRDGADVRVSDLTIRGAQGSALLVKKSSKLRVARVRLLDSATGLILNDSVDARIENVVCANNRVGMVLSRCEKSTIVNCTIADNTSLAMSIAGGRACAIFNNLMVNSQTGIYCTRDAQEITLDDNLYVAQFVGKLAGEPTRRSVESWRDLTGYDKHSISLAVEFADAKLGDYRPSSPLAWAPVRATSSDWGVRSAGGAAAPEKDIDGKDRIGEVDLGAYEVGFPKPRPAAGTFSIPPSEGVSSAGLYTNDGRNIAFLFQNLPLRAGSYEFWLPSRSFTGETIPAGEYELRVAHSNLKLEYIAATGNTGRSNALEDLASVDPQLVAFDAHDNVILTQSGFENDQHVRSFDPNFDQNRWVLHGGGNSVGAVGRENGELFVLRLADDTGKVNLIKLDAETGKGIPISGDSFAKIIDGVFSPKVRGMTVLGETLVVADPEKNKLFVTPTSELSFTKSLDVPAPTHPAADAKRKLIWVISDGAKLLAIDPASGVVKHEASPVPQPCALAISGDRLAVASASQRKIVVLDCSDPANLKPILSIGRGDGPHGPLAADRFFGAKSLAINSKGEVAVVDDSHVALFAADGAPKRFQMAVWGQHVSHGRFANDDREHFFDIAGKYSFVLDARNRSWVPENFYNIPENLTGGRSIHGTFASGGKTYGVYSMMLKGHAMLIVVRFDEHAKVTPLIGYAFDESAKGMTSRVDTNGDGSIDEKDSPTPLKIDEDVINARPRVREDGSIVTNANIVAFKGVDGSGIPAYDWNGRRKLQYLAPAGDDATFTSPYDLKTKESAATVQDQVILPDGSCVATIKLKSGGGPGFNGGGTDVAGFDASGKMRWFHALNPPGRSLGLVGMQWAAGVHLTARGSENEFIAIDPDGLGLGNLGPTPAFRWRGMWLDHNEQYRMFVGNDGKPYVVTGDYSSQAYHWQALLGYDAIERQKISVSVDATRAAELGALPGVPYPAAPNPKTVTITIKKLAAPLAIDGDPKKWRALGLSPQIVVTPETGQGIDGPADCSAVIRLAYESKNLYVQVIKFDDVVTMHQPLKFHYKQDSTEMCVNGFMGGFKFNVTRTREHGDTIFRDRFMFPNLDLVADPNQAPRVIKVLDNAREIEERALIESTYGVDLSACKVIITEFKLPLDYMWSPERLPIKIESGAGFWLGFFIDDNDTPGLDVQNLLAWPATFQAYGQPEQGAWAKFE